MRKLTLFFGAIMALALTACGKKAPVMYDKEGFKQIITLFEDSPVKDKEFNLIFFQSGEALKGNTLDFGRFMYWDQAQGKIILQEFNFPKKWDEAKAVDDSQKEGDLFKLKDINADKVVDAIKEGIEKFKDEYPDYENFNVSCIFLVSNGKAGEYEVGFKMEFTEIGKATQTRTVGRTQTTTTTYYRVMAQKKDGQWTFEPEED